MDALEQAKYELIEAGGRTAQSFGLSALLGRMFMLLYVKRDPVCLEELADELGVSKASASIAGRQLQSWGAVKRVWQKGDRRDFYAAATSLKELINNGLMDIVTKKLDSAEVQIRRCRELLNEAGEGNEDVELMRERLEEADRYRSKVAALTRNKLLRKLL